MIRVDFGLGPEALSEETKKLWGHEFMLIYSVTLSKSSLETKMVVSNPGKSSFDFNVLFHTYFRVPVSLCVTILSSSSL